MSNIKMSVTVKGIRVIPESIRKMRSVIEAKTNIKTRNHELLLNEETVIGFKFDEQTFTIAPMLDCLEEFPVISSVKTKDYEKHIYQVGSRLWDVQIFFSSAETGTVMVVQIFEKSS